MLTKENACRVWTPQNVEDLQRMIKEGFSSADIARETGRSICAVESKRKKLGMIKKPRPTLLSNDEILDLGALLKEGLSDSQIAARMCRSKNTVAHYRAKLYPTVRTVAPRPHPTPIPRNLTASVVLASSPLAPHDLDFSRRRYATTAFLISMLRAGHKPGQGEFAITSDNRVMRPSDLVGA